MTREEAKRILQSLALDVVDDDKLFNAFALAISALSAEPTEWNYKNVEDWANEHNIVLVSDEWYEKAHSALSAEREKGTQEISIVVREKGEWIHKGQDIYCSLCNKESAYNAFGASKFSDFCPNCGADMRGGKE